MRSGISRRTFLKGAGVSVALPFLPSLMPKGAWAAGTPPLRMLYYYVPNGLNMAAFSPTGSGREFELSPTLSPLAPYKSDLLILSGINNEVASPNGSGGHGAGTGGCLTAHSVVKTEGEGISNSISVDQKAVLELKPETMFRSMQLGAEGGGSVGNCDSGYSCAYVRNISWAGPTTPLQKLVEPRVVFDRMYAGDDPNATRAQREKRRRYNKSVLDVVLADANSLKNKLGRTDRLKLEEYTTGVRELETRITRPPAAACGEDPLPGEDLDFADHVRVISDLMVTAFQCDMTRVITFMLANGISNRTYGFLDVKGGHHEISHHQGDPGKLAKLATIDRWEMAQFAYLVGRLKSIDEGEGSLLDNCMLMFTSEMSDGDSHSQEGVPVVIAGKCGGAFSTGRRVVYGEEATKGSLFVSVLNAFGVAGDTFGEDGAGALAGLKL